ncbi:methyltransferase domain-containing protein [Agromyces sp. GXS1127]|uniref:class I SAM-dependent methyltransferase n=1 Tax=Agromyces sp. GXS1127 TaxID=3424181 RepID=UPI003D311F90
MPNPRSDLPESAPSIASVGARGFEVDLAGGSERIDTLIAGRRVWSVTASPESARVEWPPTLAAHVRGPADVELRGADSSVLWAGRIEFAPGTHGDGRFVDARGRELVVNKWGRPARAVEGDDAFADRLMTSLDAVIAVLEELGMQPFITGGTLLGAIRSGDFLPHDDDADVGYVSKADGRVDVVLESLELERALAAAGFDVRPHSRSHLQVLFSDAEGRVDHYVDLFPGFTIGDRYCQPIAVRTPARGLAILPRTTVPLAGADMPSVADPETWLARTYGPAWRTPDPSFRFETPPSTRRRFENWFGVYNTNREFWEDLHADPDAEEAVDARLLELLRDRWSSATGVIDLGSGTGALATALAGPRLDVVAVDFSRPGLTRANETADAAGVRVRTVECNLADGRALLGAAAPLLRQRRDWHVVLGHVLEGLVPETRAQVLRVVRHLIDGGGEAVATIGTELPPDYRHEDPRTWHLPVGLLQREAADAGLRIETLSTGSWHSLGARRREATVVMTAEQRGRNR